MSISAAVLRRRQLDLDKRTAELNKYFDLQTYDALKRMPQYWRQLDRDITARIAALYKKMGATQDPEKLKVLVGKMNRLDAYAAQIRADIDRYTYGFDTWTTGKLKQNFEKAYYMNAWGLEQAAKVTANIPVLSQAQILGVLVNPWLPDGHTYSRRIRANADLLAYEMKGVMEKAVKEGLGWNETARLISQKTEENYFRAVTLARTEMTRAQALGASYSYIQNNDILDGKRWNATLDSKTAAKDAANDGEIFDLEYDTPENPGVPGKRIPNHPNCRCIWSPVLSALGVNDKERIAKDNDGNRIYTPARTYREYAKLRGLPDLDDRLVNDKLNKYLRPGESLDDLKKTVKRFTFNGTTVNVPLPSWVNQASNYGTSNGRGKKVVVKAPAVSLPKKKRPLIVDKLANTVGNHYSNGVIGSGSNIDRKAMAQAMLDDVGLGKIPLEIKDLGSGTRGACSIDYRSDPEIHILSYGLQDLDDRSDAYKVKTAFHELFHASMDDIKHDILTSGYSFNDWVNIEETFTESAAHYLAGEAGITGLQPAYSRKLVENLPLFKQLSMFKNCNTIEDFGEVMVQYRMVDKKDSVWKPYIDIVMQRTDNPIEYVINHYEDYINNNFDALFDKITENNPILLTDPDFKYQAKIAWEDAVNYRYLSKFGNKESFFYDIAAAAMKAQGVK